MSWMTPDRPKQIIIKNYKPQHPLLQAEGRFSFLARVKEVSKKAKKATKAKTKATKWERLRGEHQKKGKRRKKRMAIAGFRGSLLPPEKQKERIFENLRDLTSTFNLFYYWTYLQGVANKQPLSITELESESNLPKCLDHSLCNRERKRDIHCKYKDETKYTSHKIQKTLNTLLQAENAHRNGDGPDKFERLWNEEKNLLSQYIVSVWIKQNVKPPDKTKEDAIKNLIGENGIQNKINTFQQREKKWGYWFNCEHEYRRHLLLIPKNLDKWISEAFGINTTPKIERQPSKNPELDCDEKYKEIGKKMAAVLSKMSKIKYFSVKIKDEFKKGTYLTTNTYFVAAYVAISKFSPSNNITKKEVRNLIFDRLARYIGISDKRDPRDKSIAKFSEALYNAFVNAGTFTLDPTTNTLTKNPDFVSKNPKYKEINPKDLFSEEEIKRQEKLKLAKLAKAAAAEVHDHRRRRGKRFRNRKSKKK